MKKLALLSTAAAVLTLPIAAQAGKYHSKNKDQYDVRVETTTTMKHHTVTTDRQVTPQKFAVEGINGSIMIEGEKIYFVEPDGDKYFAPDGPYTTAGGVTYYSNDGIVTNITAPQNVVYVDADLIDTNNNGVIDNVDVNTTTKSYNN